MERFRRVDVSPKIDWWGEYKKGLRKQAYWAVIGGFAFVLMTTLWIMMLLTGRVPAHRSLEYFGAVLLGLGVTALCFWITWRVYLTTNKRKWIFAVFLIIFICLSVGLFFITYPD